jgi:hypothetical protein
MHGSYYVADATCLHGGMQITGVWRRLHNDQLTPPEQFTDGTSSIAEGQLWLHLPYAVNADDHLCSTYLMGEQSFHQRQRVQPARTRWCAPAPWSNLL